jgi:hypothetical protein
MLAERGTKVVLGARRPERLEALAGRIAASGGEAAWARADVTRREDLSRLVELACERFGRLDVLVGNAGIGPVSLLDDVRVGDWDDMIDVNIKGVLYGIATALPVFRKQGFGHFVHICIHGRTDGRADHGGLFDDKNRSARDFERPTSGGGSQTVRHDRHARVRVDGVGGVCDGPAIEGPIRRVARRVRDPTGRDCPRDRVRD